MGLSLNQALNTASMGLQAAEKSINVIGNNLANTNTTGFKANRADFADMFSRTYTYGAAPSTTNGGTNPMQIGLGVTLAGVSTDFTQGGVKDGMTNTDMAIQGRGFFILSPDPSNSTTQQYYSRNGVMKLNENGDLLNSNGMYVLGFTVNDKYQIQTDKLSTLRIPLGEMKIAEATENVVLEGLLNATGDSATQGTVLQSGALTDLSKSNPGSGSATLTQVPEPNITVNGSQGKGETGSGNVEEGTYYYRFTYLGADGSESDYSLPVEAIVGEGEDSIRLIGLPSATEDYSQLCIYRADAPEDPTEPGVFHKIAEIAISDSASEYLDTFSSEEILENSVLNQDQLNGKYTYYVTYYDAYGNESTPSALSDALTVNGGMVELSDIPAVEGEENSNNWVGRNIYRCTANNKDSYYKVGSIDNMDASATFRDGVSDSELVGNQQMNFAGQGNVLASESTKLVDLGQVNADGTVTQYFEPGTLEFTPSKGDADLKKQLFEITENTTIAEYLDFINEAFGLRTSGTDNIPTDKGAVGQTVNGGVPGAEIIDGCITILGNSGEKNTLEIDSNAFRMVSSEGKITPLDLGFSEIQAADGESMTMTMEVYDSLGAPVTVKMTMVLEEKTNTETIYRWYADSSDNHPLTGNEIGLGTGLVRFDSEGGYIDSTNTTITVQRTDEASNSPLSFTFGMDMSAVAALSTGDPTLNMQSQDGAGAGILVDFSIGTDGTINGIFSSNVVRPIGQVLLATFINDEGLVQLGDNLYSAGVASGSATINVPGTGVAGKIKGNAIEASNVNLSNELIDMILASTMYQANSKIISTSTTMMDALLRVVS